MRRLSSGALRGDIPVFMKLAQVKEILNVMGRSVKEQQGIL